MPGPGRRGWTCSPSTATPRSRRTIPAPGKLNRPGFVRDTPDSPGRFKPLFEAAAANITPHSPAEVETDNAERGPLLLVMGGRDHTVPEAITKSLKQYRHSSAVTDLIEFADRGHSLTVDHGWREVAAACLSWLHEGDL